MRRWWVAWRPASTSSARIGGTSFLSSRYSTYIVYTHSVGTQRSLCKFFLHVFEGTFTLFFKHKKSKRVTKQQESRFFLLFLHDDRRIWIRIQSRIRIRIHTSDQWIWIREPPKNVDPVDPDSDPHSATLMFSVGIYLKPDLKSSSH